jgi:hypothetical protein
MLASIVAVTHRATDALTRRVALLALGGATATAVAHPLFASAGKAGKKAKKKCQRQEGACRRFFVDVCDTNQSCTEHTNMCCAHFKTCDARAAIECLALLV